MSAPQPFLIQFTQPFLHGKSHLHATQGTRAGSMLSGVPKRTIMAPLNLRGLFFLGVSPFCELVLDSDPIVGAGDQFERSGGEHERCRQ